MEDYFARSQRVRREIEKNPTLIEQLRKHMYEENFLEFIAQGTMNSHYRVGRLESGVWVCLRQRGANGCEFPIHLMQTQIVLGIYESYAQNAEKYNKANKKVSSFLIGILTQNGNSGILIEDLTHGGTRRIISSRVYGTITGKYEDDNSEVYLDLDNKDPIPTNKFKYMAREHCVIL